jgi:hypothetical protein
MGVSQRLLPSSTSCPKQCSGIPGHGREVSFRLLHIWEFRYGLMSRENVWLDGGSVVAQLTA